MRTRPLQERREVYLRSALIRAIGAIMSAAAVRVEPTVASELRRAAGALRAAGMETPDLDARMLLAHAAGSLTGQLARTFDRLAPDATADLDTLLARRIAGEPVSRIVGRRGFWTLDLEVTPAVLDPRPDTETVVQAALDVLRLEGRAREPLRVLDLGTGSGAILLALLSELPQARGTGIDVSAEALAVASRNSARHGLEDRAEFTQADFATFAGTGFDLVVSNPPYIRSADIAALPIEVREHDPRPALDGGADGLDAYRAILPRLPGLLASRGLAVLEIGYGQQEEVGRLVTQHGLGIAACRSDLGAIPRALVIRRKFGVRRQRLRKILGESA